jgi:hypothetical protein
MKSVQIMSADHVVDMTLLQTCDVWCNAINPSLKKEIVKKTTPWQYDEKVGILSLSKENDNAYIKYLFRGATLTKLLEFLRLGNGQTFYRIPPPLAHENFYWHIEKYFGVENLWIVDFFEKTWYLDKQLIYDLTMVAYCIQCLPLVFLCSAFIASRVRIAVCGLREELRPQKLAILTDEEESGKKDLHVSGYYERVKILLPEAISRL